MEGDHVIEVNDLMIAMESQLKPGCSVVMNEKKTGFPLLKKINRVPHDSDNDVYKPKVVSIGPYHYKTEATLEMERKKWDSFRYILELNPKMKMRDYLQAMAGLEQQIRSCYSDEIDINSDKFLKMMLLDGCLILYFLHGIRGVIEPIPKLDMPSSSNIDYENCTDNAYYSEQWYTSFFTLDLILLENQIPFVVVIKIYELVTGGKYPISVLLENIAMFIEDQLHPYTKTVLRFHQLREISHLLHLCHLHFKPKKVEVSNITPNLETFQLYQLHHCDDDAQSTIAGQQLLEWHQASEYQKAGVEFMKQESCTENPHSILDIVFCEGVMEIPLITIDRNTHCLFRNLLAFEETCPEVGNYITTYIVFLSQFIHTPEDVSLLTRQGVIVHQLDSDADVCDLFKMLAEGVNFDINSDHYLKHSFYEMEVHYQMQRPRWREWLGLVGSKLSGRPRETKFNQLCRRSSPEDRV